MTCVAETLSEGMSIDFSSGMACVSHESSPPSRCGVESIRAEAGEGGTVPTVAGQPACGSYTSAAAIWPRVASALIEKEQSGTSHLECPGRRDHAA